MTASLRFLTALIPGDATEIEIPAATLTAVGTMTIAANAISTITTRGGPPRRELLWIRDLLGDQIGVVS